MKKVVFISGAISVSIIAIGALFKVQHWPGAGPLLLVGVILFALLFIPTFTKFLYDRVK
jgi:hypothetical protein